MLETTGGPWEVMAGFCRHRSTGVALMMSQLQWKKREAVVILPMWASVALIVLSTLFPRGLFYGNFVIAVFVDACLAT